MGLWGERKGIVFLGKWKPELGKTPKPFYKIYINFILLHPVPMSGRTGTVRTDVGLAELSPCLLHFDPNRAVPSWRRFWILFLIFLRR